MAKFGEEKRKKYTDRKKAARLNMIFDEEVIFCNALMHQTKPLETAEEVARLRRLIHKNVKEQRRTIDKLMEDDNLSDSDFEETDEIRKID
jgi:hypothetical protein